MAARAVSAMDGHLTVKAALAGAGILASVLTGAFGATWGEIGAAREVERKRQAAVMRALGGIRGEVAAVRAILQEREKGGS